MQYTASEIEFIPLIDFMAALGEKPVKSFENMKFYYAPNRNDPEPMLLVDTKTNRWYDYATEQSGDIIDLAELKMNPKLYTDPRSFILKYINEYERGKELSHLAHRPEKPIVVGFDIKKVMLTDFMKAIGQEYPVATDGNLYVYNAPYDDRHKPTMVINTETNEWFDTKSGAYGGILDLAYELTGSSNVTALKHYIAGEMGAFDKPQKTTEQKKEAEKPPKPKRRMRL